MQNNFGELLSEYITRRKLTSRKLLEQLWDTEECDREGKDGRPRHKYNEPDVSKWKSGTTRPPAHIVELLEDILATPKGLLLEAAGYHAEAELVKLSEQKERPNRSLTVSIREVGGNACDPETGRGGELIAFTLGNYSENVITVNRICLEVLSCEPFNEPPPVAARIMSLKYEVALRPGYLGEYTFTGDRFRYEGPSADDFEVVCKSPGGFKYRTRLNIYASDLATGKEFTVRSPTFEIFFYKEAGGRDILARYHPRFENDSG
jgi:hypothetical protein